MWREEQKIVTKVASTTKPGQVNEGMPSIDNNTLLQTGGFTKISNIFIDIHQGKLSWTQLKCYLLISRKTVGFRKESDSISLSQFVKNGCSKDHNTVRKALVALAKKKLISITPVSGCPNMFSLLAPTKKGRGDNSYTQKKISALAKQGDYGDLAFDELISLPVSIENVIYHIHRIKKLNANLNQVELIDDLGKQYLAEMTQEELVNLRGSIS